MERLCASSDVPEGEVFQVDLGDGRVLAVYRFEDAVFATDDLCSHGDASLADGEIEDGKIVCPYHLGSFCIKTGEPTGAPCSVPIKTYQVEEIDGEIMLIA
ncbi:putative 2Fe-2S ferredoxin [Caenibius tardaugens NBRC 16725]|uniref:Putative 2Fe-2S ferredoxin n=1 Tax=Caenibius tardaugens NBRC 16725 TaxID=1219035 RepID=U2YNN6_9SPHN|nr:non-heme iron oxygenase ferredoxin subunit [Caenibius tardaugens]GAD50192.1 putative 2Fe-2S ferredoxin [Caenibius tardaugens NBRC 16725]